MPIPTLGNVPKINLSPWNTQPCWTDTGDPKFKQHSTFTMDRIACLEDSLNSAVSGGSADTTKELKTYFLKADGTNPVANASVPASKVLAIDIVSLSFEHEIRVKVTLETGSGDIDRYFVVGPEDQLEARFNSDTIKAIEMDVLNGSRIAQATANGLEAANLAVFDGASFPASTEVAAQITVLNA